MSIRLSLLTLLQRGPRYGYQLRSEFEAHTGGSWPLNVGQVYTTLARLERDGLVTAAAEAGGDHDPQVDYLITDAGRAEVARWFETPVERSTPPRDELAIKLALAVTAEGVDPRDVISTQRTATLRAMRDYTRLKHDASDEDLAWSLVLDSRIFAAEAEIRWLDHCEARVARAAARTAGGGADGGAGAARASRGKASRTGVTP